MAEIETGNFGNSVGQMLGLGVGLGLGVAAYKGVMKLAGKKPRQKAKKHRRTNKKKPRKGRGALPTLSFKQTKNLFYPANWSVK